MFRNFLSKIVPFVR